MDDEKQLLPVGAVLPELFAALRSAGGAVLAAAPGAGKTTLVPGACLDEPEFASGRILLLEPRRVAARAAARRIASLLGEPVGRRVGYIVRGDSRYTKETRILVVTEGVLIRRIQEDPMLEDTALVIFDEFHERSLDADLGLALVLDLRNALRPELKVLVMSATLETEAVARLLGDVPVIEAPGRQFPVEQRWSAAGTLDRFHPAPAVARACAGLYREKAGDMLVFLPGMAEIEATRALLETMLPEEALLLPLHGSLSPAEQDCALQPAPPGRRKVVLATNIAESSLTIDGVTLVVDSGLERRLRYSPAAGISFLELGRISQASAAQRSGGPGGPHPEQPSGSGANLSTGVWKCGPGRRFSTPIWPVSRWSWPRGGLLPPISPGWIRRRRRGSPPRGSCSPNSAPSTGRVRLRPAGGNWHLCRSIRGWG